MVAEYVTLGLAPRNYVHGQMWGNHKQLILCNATLGQWRDLQVVVVLPGRGLGRWFYELGRNQETVRVLSTVQVYHQGNRGVGYGRVGHDCGPPPRQGGRIGLDRRWSARRGVPSVPMDASVSASRGTGCVVICADQFAQGPTHRLKLCISVPDIRTSAIVLNHLAVQIVKGARAVELWPSGAAAPRVREVPALTRGRRSGRR